MRLVEKSELVRLDLVCAAQLKPTMQAVPEARKEKQPLEWWRHLS